MRLYRALFMLAGLCLIFSPVSGLATGNLNLQFVEKEGKLYADVWADTAGNAYPERMVVEWCWKVDEWTTLVDFEKGGGDDYSDLVYICELSNPYPAVVARISSFHTGHPVMDSETWINPSPYTTGTPFTAASNYNQVDIDASGNTRARGGLNTYNEVVPIGGCPDGTSTRLLWLSSSEKNLQHVGLPVGGFSANCIYIAADCGWWDRGDTMQGQRIIKITVSGPGKSVEKYLVSGENIWEWTRDIPDPAPNTEKIKNNDPSTGSTYVTRFDLPDMSVESVELELLVETKADDSRQDQQQIIEFFGITLGRE